MKPLSFRLAAVAAAAAAVLTPLLAQAEPSFEYRSYKKGFRVAAQPAPSQPELQLSTKTVNFGDVPLNTAETRQVLVSNSGAGAVTFSAAPWVSGSSAFSTTSSCAPSLAPGGSCLATVQFLPTAEGSASGTLSITSSLSGAPQQVSLSGRGVATRFGAYAEDGATLISSLPAFAETAVGSTSAALTFQVKNEGGLAGAPMLTASPSQFTVSGCTSSLAPGASCTASVTFTPTAAGSLQGSVSVAGATVGGPVTLGLAGTSPVVVASLRGNGSSTAGACASGQTGCAVLNAADKDGTVTVQADFRTASAAILGGYAFVRATQALGADKYYWEVTKVSGPTSTSNVDYFCGVSKAGTALNGYPYSMEPTAYSAYSFQVPAGTVIRCSYDSSTRALSANFNGSVTVKTLAAGTYHPMLTLHSTYVYKVNFGQEAFTYAPPSGYKAGLF